MRLPDRIRADRWWGFISWSRIGHSRFGGMHGYAIQSRARFSGADFRGGSRASRNNDWTDAPACGSYRVIGRSSRGVWGRVCVYYSLIGRRVAAGELRLAENGGWDGPTHRRGAVISNRRSAFARHASDCLLFH